VSCESIWIWIGLKERAVVVQVQVQVLMATKRGGDKSKSYELNNYPPPRRQNEFIERLVLSTDTLQGLALLYNTTVADLKKLNNLHTESDLHARRVLKVPSRGILINLEEPVTTPTPLLTPSGSGYFSSEDDENSNNDNNGQLYLDSKDSLIQEIREKAENDAANSPILSGPDDGTLQIRVYNAILDRKGKGSSLKWWHVLLPCLGFIIIFPIAVFLFQEHIHHLEHSSTNHNLSLAGNSTDHRYHYH